MFIFYFIERFIFIVFVRSSLLDLFLVCGLCIGGLNFRVLFFIISIRRRIGGVLFRVFIGVF